MSLQRGIDIRMALFDFKMELQQCGKCVAHNYEFDSNVLQIEAQRHNMSLYFPSPFCTMRVGTDLCKLPHPSFTGGGFVHCDCRGPACHCLGDDDEQQQQQRH